MILDTDASAGSIGCVLSQIQDGHERVIASELDTKLFEVGRSWPVLHKLYLL